MKIKTSYLIYAVIGTIFACLLTSLKEAILKLYSHIWECLLVCLSQPTFSSRWLKVLSTLS